MIIILLIWSIIGGFIFTGLMGGNYRVKLTALLLLGPLAWLGYLFLFLLELTIKFGVKK